MKHKNLVLYREQKKPIVWDAFFNKKGVQKPLVIFCHGYKGFKDWGPWDLVGDSFLNAELFFVKFNFSHNGGTVENPIDFPDLEAFAENNYTKELEDLNDILDYLLSTKNPYLDEINPNNITIIGHSRAGGITTIKAAEDSRITNLITWASICDFGKRSATIGDLEQWRKDGVKYILNGRTKQKMPHNFQFYEDFKANEARLNIEVATRKIKIPHLIIHGENDESIAFTEAESIHSWNPKSILFSVSGANHVFNAKHPWKVSSLPSALKKTVNKSISFIK